ncbi:MAG: hypothetical protein Fur0028_09140 [Bacteroidales bacterium]
MKNKNKYLLIFFLILVTILGCKKMDISNIDHKILYVLKNETDDTLLWIMNYYNGTYNKIKKSKISPGEVKNTLYYDSCDSLLLYKVNDTNNVYVKFLKNGSPYNYKLNYFNKESWNLYQYSKIDTYNVLLRHSVYKEFCFTINYENIINLK